ncbi:MAG TPA: sugar ABC transporter substrate-binding protein, partial [Anaerolineae bacterium]|nr:sugar ABC transporter substrate-binding protein [Anaerolineae bacterium]
YYNKKLFDEAGVPYPDETWTWDTFLDAAKKLTKKDASGRVTQYALGMEGGKWELWVGQAGGTILDDMRNPSKCTLTDPKAMKGIQWFYDLMNEGYAMRSATLNQQGGDAAVFQTGQVAMIIQNASRVPTFNLNPDLDYDVAPIPIPKDGKRHSVAGGAAWVMSAQSDNKEAAWTFMQWLQSKGGGQSMYTKNGEIFPALKSVANSEEFLGLGKPANRKAFLIEAAAAEVGRFGYFPEWGELNGSILNPQMDRLWTGEATPEEVIPALCEQVDQFLKDNGYPK